MCYIVATKHGGSLKAEHGTGRNVAPYVEMEWGETAYNLMWELKELFDPEYVLNPGVILNRVRRATTQSTSCEVRKALTCAARACCCSDMSCHIMCHAVWRQAAARCTKRRWLPSGCAQCRESCEWPA